MFRDFPMKFHGKNPPLAIFSQILAVDPGDSPVSETAENLGATSAHQQCTGLTGSWPQPDDEKPIDMW